MYARLLLPVLNTKDVYLEVSCSRYLLPDGGENYGLAECRNARRPARLWLRAQREGPRRAREEGLLDTGQTINRVD